MANPHPSVTDTKATHEKSDPAFERAMRGWSKHLYVWGLCDNSACRRARACRGMARPCVKAKYSRLPEGVQVWFELIAGAKEYYEVPFEQVMHALDSIGANQALREWQAAVDSGEDMRAPGAVQEVERRCVAFAQWWEKDKAMEEKERSAALRQGLRDIRMATSRIERAADFSLRGGNAEPAGSSPLTFPPPA